MAWGDEGSSAVAATAAPSKVPRPKGTKRLHGVFQLYASFNQRGPRKSKQPRLSSSKFSKMVRESGILQPGITSAKVDCAFMQAKAGGRSSSRISFDEFKTALELLAARIVAASDDDDELEPVYQKLVRKIEANPGPLLTDAQLAGEGVKKGDVYSRLTDHRGYRSTHRHRFDRSTGMGMGRMGRTELRDYTFHMSQLVRPSLGGRTDILKDPSLTVDAIQQMGCAKRPTFMAPVHRGGSLPNLPALPKMQLRSANSGWY
jgi:hypothetical protein